MSQDSVALRAASPNSGRSSPISRYRPQANEDVSNAKDRAYRRFALNLERALASFDTTQQEWADYISFLSRLLKALQTQPPGTRSIPEAESVAKRLAQCLMPNLPSGVHQKALEVYGYIFKTIGADVLARDLHIYFAGLASTLMFASLTVRPLYLSLFEDHIAQLEPNALRPALKSIILSLLPGLEDETSEDFDRVLQVLDSLRERPSSEHENEPHGNGEQAEPAPRGAYFWQCFFLATITNPSRRQGALAYLSRYLPKFETAQGFKADNSSDGLSQAAKSALTPEPGLLIRCFASGLSDQQILVQRGFLDLLVSHLPLSSTVLQLVVPSADLDRLITAAMSVVARRDMGLNRRLWGWFLGPDLPVEKQKSPTSIPSPTSDVSQYHAAYFAKLGLKALTRSVIALLNRNVMSATERARPFRICLSLMDRWEVGGLLVPHIFVPALRNAYEYAQSVPRRDSDEVLKSASNFFDGVESGLIWAKIVELSMAGLGEGSRSSQERLSDIQLCAFIIQRFNTREEEMIACHVPMTALILLHELNHKDLRNPGEKEKLALEVVEKLASIIPQKAFAISDGYDKLLASASDIVSRLKKFYEQEQGAVEDEAFPIPMAAVGSELLRQAIMLFLKISRATTNVAAIDGSTKIVCSLVRIVSNAPILVQELRLVRAIHDVAERSPDANSFPIFAAATVILAAIQNMGFMEVVISQEDLLHLQESLMRLIWSYLDPKLPQYHVEAVRCLWLLAFVTQSTKSFEAALTSLISERSMTGFSLNNDESDRSCVTMGEFATLWTHSIQEKQTHSEKGQRLGQRRASSVGLGSAHVDPAIALEVLSRPLFLILDSLLDDASGLGVSVRSWLQQLPSLSKVFTIVTTAIRQLDYISEASQPELVKPRTKSSRRGQSSEVHDLGLYHMLQLKNIILHASEHTWIVLYGEMVPSLQPAEDESTEVNLQELLVQICMRTLTRRDAHSSLGIDLERASLDVLRLLFEGPNAASLRTLRLDDDLIIILRNNVGSLPPLLQAIFLETTSAALRLRPRVELPEQQTPRQRQFSRDSVSSPSQTSLLRENSTKESHPASSPPPIGLVDCLKAGFSASSSRMVLDEWVEFLREVLPLLADSFFQQLIPLVECLCKQIDLVFENIREAFNVKNTGDQQGPSFSTESSLISLLNGLEQVLAKAHEKLVTEESHKFASRTPDQPQTFFGNVTHMTQGLFTAESEKLPLNNAGANNRLAVILCFQDTLKCCFRIWTWGAHGQQTQALDLASAASFGYTSLRLRKRALRVLENLVAAEPLECLELLATLYCHPSAAENNPEYVLELLNVLNGSRPKNTAPAIFTAIVKRVHADPAQDGMRTTDLTALNLVDFLIDYMKSIEDDAMDEIWPDCLNFLKGVLSNPMDYSHILPLLLSFMALMAEKVDNTNFGEQRKMRKELGDVFLRLLTAAFTALGPTGFMQDANQLSVTRSRAALNGMAGSSAPTHYALTLASVVLRLSVILNDNERISIGTNSISVNAIGPAVRAKSFPKNIDQPFLELLLQTSRVSQGSKAWKKDVADALQDPKFFSLPYHLAQEYMVDIIHQLSINDKERMAEFLARLTPPTTAGIVFGVGATSARLDADRRTQLNLRRIALFILASDEDNFVDKYRMIEEKLVELLTATPTSSPSSTTRAEIFLVLRALILRSSPTALSAFWPLINSEVQNAMLSVLPDSSEAEKYSNASVIQACRVLDLLVTLSLDDFQLHEWLFITDTIDAVYRPASTPSVALADEIAEALGNTGAGSPIAQGGSPFDEMGSAFAEGKRRSFLDPLLSGLEDVEAAEVKLLPRRDLATRVLQPFFGQLSIWAYEATYGMLEADLEGCERALVRDLFEESEAA